MLETKKYLLDGGSLESLHNDLGIRICKHPQGLPLVILNYNQINSPKSHPIVRECRQLIFEESPAWNIVARSFFRFFNWGEMKEEMPLFEWEGCWSSAKEDGSLLNLFNYDGDWHIATRASFGK